MVLNVVVVGVDNVGHHVLAGEGDIVEDAPAQEGVGQLFLRVGGDDDDGALLGGDGLFGLGDVELHLVQLPQQVVGELQVGLVDLVDEEDDLLVGGEGPPQLAQRNQFLDVIHPFAAELAVVEPLDGVIDIQAVLGLGGGLDVPNDELFAQGLGDGVGQHGFAGAGLPLDEQGLLQGDGNVYNPQQVLRDHVLAASLEFVHGAVFLSFVNWVWFMTKSHRGSDTYNPFYFTTKSNKSHGIFPDRSANFACRGPGFFVRWGKGHGGEIWPGKGAAGVRECSTGPLTGRW